MRPRKSPIACNKQKEAISNELWNMASLHSMQGFLPFCGEEFDLGSPCTQRSLIDLLNILFLVIYSSGLLIYSFNTQYNSRNRPSQWDFIIISVCCAVTGIAYFSTGVRALILEEFKFMGWRWLPCLIRSLTWISLSVSLNIQPIGWVQNLSLVWWISFSFLISAHNLTILLIHHHNLQILDLLTWPVSLLLLFCAFKLIVQMRHQKRNPEDGLSQPLLSEKSSKNAILKKAGLFSRLTFSWLNPLLRLGYSKPLHLNDIPPLDLEDEAMYAYKKFFQVWDLQRQQKGKSRNQVSISLAKCYLMEILLTGFYALLRTVSVSASPVLLYAFVQYIYLEERDLNMGLSLVGLLMVTKLVESLSQRHWFFQSRRLGMRMRSALMVDACI